MTMESCGRRSPELAGEPSPPTSSVPLLTRGKLECAKRPELSVRWNSIFATRVASGSMIVLARRFLPHEVSDQLGEPGWLVLR
jgi:hypothetical protein